MYTEPNAPPGTLAICDLVVAVSNLLLRENKWEQIFAIQQVLSRLSLPGLLQRSIIDTGAYRYMDNNRARSNMLVASSHNLTSSQCHTLTFLPHVTTPLHNHFPSVTSFLQHIFAQHSSPLRNGGSRTTTPFHDRKRHDFNSHVRHPRKLLALLLYATYILLEVRILENVYSRQHMNAKRVHERSILEEMVTRRRKRRNVSDSEGLHVVMEL